MFADKHFHLMRVLLHEYTAQWNAIAPGLTKPQYAVLTALAQRPGMTQGALAEAAGMTKTALAELLVRLEERGVVERRVSPDDTRCRLVSLTPTGADLVAAARPLCERLDAAFLAPLDAAEQATLLDLLQRIRPPV
ncbi:MarR family transcriptional regulator [Nocardioides sp. BP30]|uniref:MarR family winged helix-turn-helix transcriptional regulator n=1 Tax=Nocardioides sp. BP30 TaxID=3036374 RepID=UPI0024690B00|nr:MarR family transcriptional regulator [Nocardioides sp. BP30]WGL52118.1 MarR family transcriptional regulator [Nocardioides sp. BP30]